MTAQPGYDDWLRFCFDHEVSDPQWYWECDDYDWREPEPDTLAEYLTRLFSNSRDLLDEYSPEQVEQGLRFICGIGSEYFHRLRGSNLAHETQAACVRSIGKLYTDLFARECSHFYGHLDDGPETPHPLNGLCYMFWDMDCLEGAARRPGEEPLVEPIFEVLECAIGQPSPACVESALHGLGHLCQYHPERVQRIIEDYLQSQTDAGSELKTYAQRALTGCVL